MGRERWFRGDQRDRSQHEDEWYALAVAHEIPFEQARALHAEAVRYAGQQAPPWRIEAIYIALLEETRAAAARPAPGKVSRTMRMHAARTGKPRAPHVSRLTGEPIAPGKRN